MNAWCEKYLKRRAIKYNLHNIVVLSIFITITMKMKKSMYIKQMIIQVHFKNVTKGTLAYIAQNKILDLELWEGDRIFLEKMFRNEIPFSISLYYDEK